MITAVDTNVLLDVLGADRTFGLGSQRALAQARGEGALIVGEVVLAELSSVYEASSSAAAVLDRLEIDFVPSTFDAAALAGAAWRRYREHGGPRTRVVPDFLVGAHAVTSADRLLTRDRGFYREAFGDLEILDPTA